MQHKITLTFFFVISMGYTTNSWAITEKEFCQNMTTKTDTEKCKIELESVDFVDQFALRNCNLINGKDEEKINCLRSIANKNYTKEEIERCGKYIDGYLAEYTTICFTELGRDYQKMDVADYKPVDTVEFDFDPPLGQKAMCNTLSEQMCTGNCFINDTGVCTARY